MGQKKEDFVSGLMACTVCSFFMAAISYKWGGPNALPMTLGLGGLTAGSMITMITELIPKKNKTNKWRKLFLSMGIRNNNGEIPLTPVLAYAGTNDIGNYYVFTLPDGLSVEDFIKHKGVLEGFFKCPTDIYLNKDYKVVIQENTAKFKDVYKIDLRQNPPREMRIKIGKTIENQDVVLNLDDVALHTLVSGTNGSGKSVLLNLLIVNFILLRKVTLYLIDPKGGVEFALYRNVGCVKGFGITKSQILEILEEVESLMNKRYEILFNNGYKSFRDCPNLLPPVVVLIDEYSALKGKDKTSKRIEEILFSLLSRARASGIIVILATQRTDSSVMTSTYGALKPNLRNYLIFRAENNVDSEVVFGIKGCYKATELDTGMAYLKTGGTLTKFKSYYLTDDEIREYIRPFIENKRSKSEKDNIDTTNNQYTQKNNPHLINKKIDNNEVLDRLNRL